MPENDGKLLAEILKSNSTQVIDAWVHTVRSTIRGRLSDDELRRQTNDIFQALVDTLAETSDVESLQPAGELLRLLTELSATRARQGFSATETATSVFAAKPAVLGAMGDVDAEAFGRYLAFSTFLDRLGLATFDAYVRTRDALVAEQAEQLLELSTPVVKLWEGIVAVPLVGTLDSARSQVVMERLLQSLVDTASPFAILDITGVLAVDTQVAQHILKTVVAAQLMGAECIISGIRPQIAQTIVSLGIEFGEIVTKANLSDALQYALRRSGVQLSRRAIGA
jgi:rsbT co-antagonist protein RsbR